MNSNGIPLKLKNNKKAIRKMFNKWIPPTAIIKVLIFLHIKFLLLEESFEEGINIMIPIKMLKICGLEKKYKILNETKIPQKPNLDYLPKLENVYYKPL